MSDSDLIELAKETASKTQADKVQIVGRWIWVYFRAVPPESVRQWLKDQKYRWNSGRGCWQFAGTPSRKSRADAGFVKARYGVYAVQADGNICDAWSDELKTA